MLVVSFVVEVGARWVVEVVDCLGGVDLDGVVKSINGIKNIFDCEFKHVITVFYWLLVSSEL